MTIIDYIGSNKTASAFFGGVAASVVAIGTVYGVSRLANSRYNSGYEAGRKAEVQRQRDSPIIESGEAIYHIDPRNPNTFGVAIKRLDGIVEGAVMLPDGRTFVTRSGIKRAEINWNESAAKYINSKLTKSNDSTQIPSAGYFPPQPQQPQLQQLQPQLKPAEPKLEPQPEQPPAEPQPQIQKAEPQKEAPSSAPSESGPALESTSDKTDSTCRPLGPLVPVN